MSKGTLSFLSKVAILILCAIALTELALALWTVLENRYKSLAYSLADVGYIVRIDEGTWTKKRSTPLLPRISGS